ncbi:hypothetical protein LXA43DRAFT_1092493 [Ganoderma leucocontextum]|nr:hypothetical protein LXA43DRAFT_1092493 [Ganoderma leucocontextum]
MFLDGVLPYLSYILPSGMKDRFPTLQLASSHLPNTPESSRTGSREEICVQTDLEQVESERLQAALQDKEREVKKLRKKEQEDTRHAQSFKTELEVTRRRLEKAEADRITFERWAQQAERALSEAEHRAKHSEASVAQLSRELRRSQAELQKTTALLDTRSAELRDAQAYLCRLDDVADTEVLQLVDSVNSRVFQAAANIADAFKPRYGEQKDAEVSQEAAARLRGLLNDDLLHALGSIDHTEDPLVVQTVLQAAMVSYTRWLCVTWNFHLGDPPCLLQEVYHVIRRTEQQSIAGRWRALSRTYVKTFFADDATRQRIATDGLLDHITDILLASGICMPQQDLRMEMEGSYADALREVVHLSLEFQRITGERIISRDLLVVTANPGAPFDPSRMVDEWAEPKSARRHIEPHPVLCTTQLGLVREERKAAEEAGGEEGISAVVLLKPKVVLKSLLDELWNEQVRGTRKV